MKKIDAILIDDLSSVRQWWSESGAKAGIQCVTFSSVPEFFEEITRIPRETPIYIDSWLQDGVRGEIEAKKIYEEGFKKIYLATSEPPRNIPSYIIRCRGKVPPWELIQVG